jgi:hypothetical protein
MGLLSNIRRGKIEAPFKALLYGVEGIGKSTFGAEAEAPIFLCAEAGTENLDVDRLPEPRTWTDVLASVAALSAEPHEYQTLVIDTLDWLEPLLWDHVCAQNKWKTIEDPGYGKGYVAALGEWRLFLRQLEGLRTARKMNILMLAHSLVRRVNPPDMEPFDRYSLKIHEKAASLCREWCDAVLFARFEVVTSKAKDARVARGYSTGERELRTVYTASYDAKNRWGLPDPLPLSFPALMEAKEFPPTPEPAYTRDEPEPEPAPEPAPVVDAATVKAQATVEQLLAQVGDEAYADTVRAWCGAQPQTADTFKKAATRIRKRLAETQRGAEA